MEDKKSMNNIKELRTLTGMTIKELAMYFQIPYRTVLGWDLGERKCPDYLFKLLVYKLKQEGRISEEFAISEYHTEEEMQMQDLIKLYMQKKNEEREGQRVIMLNMQKAEFTDQKREPIEIPVELLVFEKK